MKHRPGPAPDNAEGSAAVTASDPAVEVQLAQAQALAQAMPFNTGKAHEFGRKNAIAPPRGATSAVDGPMAAASTLSEINGSCLLYTSPSPRD